LEDTRYLVRLSVPRAGGWRAWGTARDEFGRQLAEQESAAAALHVDSEIRRGRDYVRVVIVATVDAADVAEAHDLTWWTFRKGRGGVEGRRGSGRTATDGPWPTLRPRDGRKALASAALLRGNLRCGGAPQMPANSGR
jgi:hypothetical protein